LNYFRIYNRWGQLVFSTSQMGQGWDGTIGGSLQSTGNFVYMAQGIDYTGKVIFMKGNVVLIR
jgi:gliding motility-associated-like protein